jgi:hypothetical protein
LAQRSPAIATPAVDLLATGGLSILAMGALLAWAFLFDGSLDFVAGDWIVLLILINSTHFMASYRLLYVGRDEILESRWSAIYVPALLLAILAWAALGSQREPIVENLVLASSIYLAWHYTGQAWGMVSAFGRILDIDFTRTERLCIRSGMRMLLVLHVLFALSGRYPPADWIAPKTYVQLYGVVFQIVVALAVVSLLAGAFAYHGARSRAGHLPLRVVSPWLALYLWYPFWYFVPGGFLWVQLSHALQYLSFPLRVEVNRYSREAQRSAAQKRARVVWVYAGLVAIGLVVLHGPPLAAHAFGPGWYSNDVARSLFTAFAACVAIHHYFIDGAVWKLRNPKVRRELLSHLESRAERSTGACVQSLKPMPLPGREGEGAGKSRP